MGKLTISNLGYPRIGPHREWKRFIESFWSGEIGETEFVEKMTNLRISNLLIQKNLGVDIIPVNDFTYYDHVLDMATMFGIMPKRFGKINGPIDLKTYYAMARGHQKVFPCELTKWFNTNYHFIVPEYEHDVNIQFLENRPLAAYREAKSIGIDGKPVIIGPYTFAKFSKGDIQSLCHYIDLLHPLYLKMLKQLENEGVTWVQMDEPMLVTSIEENDLDIIDRIYSSFNKNMPKLNIMLQTYYDSIEFYDRLITLPVSGIGLDFVHGLEDNLKYLKKYNFPKNKILGVGIIDGRNIWRSNLQEKYSLLQEIFKIVSKERVWIQPSCSLITSPISKCSEGQLESFLYNAISFSDEKLKELKILSEACNNGIDTVKDCFKEASEALKELNQKRSNFEIITDSTNNVSLSETKRDQPFKNRFSLQMAKMNLPRLPTTTIGSFPQTKIIRQTRLDWRNGKMTDNEYEKFIRKQIRKWINIQEEIGLDVFVHGEIERNDMVEYFGEKLQGFAFTTNGWVQSYGTRCVKPPLIYGNVSYLGPMTVKEAVYAQSLTSKPVKGMITGPVTILAWSFVRDDIENFQVAYQIALALREEVLELEKASIRIIQVDEPAIRESLPLKKKNWKNYLEWATMSFRLTTCKVKAETQIHSHMCYSEFQDIMENITDLDADVISIETSRSHGEMISAFEKYNYSKGIGLGVYDIHSPRIPSKEEIVEIISRGLKVIDPALFWVNPDCGLKTRKASEAIASLKNMVAAAKHIRETLVSK